MHEHSSRWLVDHFVCFGVDAACSFNVFAQYFRHNFCCSLISGYLRYIQHSLHRNATLLICAICARAHTSIYLATDGMDQWRITFKKCTSERISWIFYFVPNSNSIYYFFSFSFPLGLLTKKRTTLFLSTLKQIDFFWREQYLRASIQQAPVHRWKFNSDANTIRS